MTSCSYQEAYRGKDFPFDQPPEAPIFRPTPEEFAAGPLGYIARIREEAEKYGICRIIPPENFTPTFAMDMDKFRFTPRIQRINELEATTRIKLNFMEQITKFWALQGAPLKVPTVEKRALDLFKLHKIVQEEGGFENVVQTRRWQKVAAKMGYSSNAFSRVTTSNALRKHYENLLYPYDVFQSGATVGGLESKLAGLNSPSSLPVDESCPLMVGIPRAGHHSTRAHSRGSNHSSGSDMTLISPPLSPNGSSELKKLQTYGPGPRMPCATLQTSEELNRGTGSSNSGGVGGGGVGGGLLTLATSQQGNNGAGSSSISTSKNKRAAVSSQLDPVIKPCVQCDLVKPYSSLLTCEDCDTNFHMGCLIPPLNTLPTGSWRCHRCLAQLVKTRPKPYASDFGFVQSQKHYSLQEFGDMADDFKSGYFRMPCNKVTTEVLEKEFWRLTQTMEETVTVEYGADLHTNDYGSGFPTALTKNLRPEDEKYVTSPWNLNNLPILDGSVFKHINQNISGMIVPWAYVGMCFSTFCWHNEDHWTYSINYLHWGEPKSWYGVPGDMAETFEQSMKNAAPDLFESQPDLLHQLVTICNPNILMRDGVPIYRTDQHAGEFVVTFPRAYHTGFNQGFNLAEAVNFAPPDWLPIGRTCVNHYSALHRFPVFSHDELVCKIAAEPDVVDVAIAEATYRDMLRMVDAERALRDSLHQWGVTKSQRVIFELLPDDERLCSHCKTTCFLSAVSCLCDAKRVVCVKDKDHICKKCSPADLTFSYRYTTEEIRSMSERLKRREESYATWNEQVKRALEPESMKENLSIESVHTRTTRLKNGHNSNKDGGSSSSSSSSSHESRDKPTLSDLQSLLMEANSLHYSKTSDNYLELKAVISNAKKCSKVARALLDQHERNLRIEKGREAARKARLRTSDSLMMSVNSPTKRSPRAADRSRAALGVDGPPSVNNKLTLEDLQLFHDEIANQLCIIPETVRVKDMLDTCDQLLERFDRMIIKGEYTFVERNNNGNSNDSDPQLQTSYSASDVEQLIRDMNFMTVVDFSRPVHQLQYKLSELRWHEDVDLILSRYTCLPPVNGSLISNGARNSFFENQCVDSIKALIDEGMNLPNMTRQIRSKLVQLQTLLEELTRWTEAMERAEAERKAEAERQAELERKAELAARKAEAQRKAEAAKRAEAARKAALAAKKAARKAEVERRARAAAAAAEEAEIIAKAAAESERQAADEALKKELAAELGAQPGEEDVKEGTEGDANGGNPNASSNKRKRKKSKKDDDEFLICELGESCRKPARIKGASDPVEWVGCDGCERWFHQYCVGVSPSDTLEGKSWFCPDCGGKRHSPEETDVSPPHDSATTPTQEVKLEASSSPADPSSQEAIATESLQPVTLHEDKKQDEQTGQLVPPVQSMPDVEMVESDPPIETQIEAPLQPIKVEAEIASHPQDGSGDGEPSNANPIQSDSSSLQSQSQLEVETFPQVPPESEPDPDPELPPKEEL